MAGWVDGGMGGWMGLRVGFININDMYNNKGAFLLHKSLTDIVIMHIYTTYKV